MNTLVDIITGLFYVSVFLSSIIVIGVFYVLSYAEIKGYIEELKQDRKDAQILRNAEGFRDDFI